MSIRLRLALIIFVIGIGCLFSSGAQATEKHIVNKSVVHKKAVKPVANKSAAVHTKKKKTAQATEKKIATKSVVHKKAVKPVANKSAAVHTKKKKTAKITKIAKTIPSTSVRNPFKLSVQSGTALVIEQKNNGGGDVLFQKNANKIVPIASITKLMTAMVVLDSSPILDAPIAITHDDIDYLRGSRSRLPVGTVISRKTALLLALMSSENRAAHALARHYPGGMHVFLSAMNIKAKKLGMLNTRFEDPTGLTRNNVSTAFDLAKMVTAAHKYQLIRQFTTTSEANIEIYGRDMAYHNTNPLVRNPAWDVGLSKTGYISEAGKCLVMQAHLAEKPVVIVLLDSAGKLTRVGDANRVKHWLDSTYASHKQSIQTVAMPGSKPKPAQFRTRSNKRHKSYIALEHGKTRNNSRDISRL